MSWRLQWARRRAAVELTPAMSMSMANESIVRTNTTLGIETA